VESCFSVVTLDFRVSYFAQVVVLIPTTYNIEAKLSSKAHEERNVLLNAQFNRACIYGMKDYHEGRSARHCKRASLDAGGREIRGRGRRLN
jgi:hypothetical protein